MVSKKSPLRGPVWGLLIGLLLAASANELPSVIRQYQQRGALLHISEILEAVGNSTDTTTSTTTAVSSVATSTTTPASTTTPSSSTTLATTTTASTSTSTTTPSSSTTLATTTTTTTSMPSSTSTSTTTLSTTSSTSSTSTTTTTSTASTSTTPSSSSTTRSSTTPTTTTTSIATPSGNYEVNFAVYVPYTSPVTSAVVSDFTIAVGVLLGVNIADLMVNYNMKTNAVVFSVSVMNLASLAAAQSLSMTVDTQIGNGQFGKALSTRPSFANLAPGSVVLGSPITTVTPDVYTVNFGVSVPYMSPVTPAVVSDFTIAAGLAIGVNVADLMVNYNMKTNSVVFLVSVTNLPNQAAAQSLSMTVNTEIGNGQFGKALSTRPSFIGLDPASVVLGSPITSAAPNVYGVNFAVLVPYMSAVTPAVLSDFTISAGVSIGVNIANLVVNYNMKTNYVVFTVGVTNLASQAAAKSLSVTVDTQIGNGQFGKALSTRPSFAGLAPGSVVLGSAITILASDMYTVNFGVIVPNMMSPITSAVLWDFTVAAGASIGVDIANLMVDYNMKTNAVVFSVSVINLASQAEAQSLTVTVDTQIGSGQFGKALVTRPSFAGLAPGSVVLGSPIAIVHQNNGPAMMASTAMMTDNNTASGGSTPMLTPLWRLMGIVAAVMLFIA